MANFPADGLKAEKRLLSRGLTAEAVLRKDGGETATSQPAEWQRFADKENLPNGGKGNFEGAKVAKWCPKRAQMAVRKSPNGSVKWPLSQNQVEIGAKKKGLKTCTNGLFCAGIGAF